MSARNRRLQGASERRNATDVLGYGALSLWRLLSEEILRGARRGDLRARFSKDSKIGPDLFLRVAQELLDREQGKFVAAAREKLKQRAEGFSGWEQMYSREEQCRRLLSRETGVPLREPLPRELPDALRDGYETLVNQALHEHPFIGLSPYEEYLRAYFLVYETDDIDGVNSSSFLISYTYRRRSWRGACLPCLRGESSSRGQPRISGRVVVGAPRTRGIASYRREGTGSNIAVHADGASWIPEIRLTETQRGLWFWRRLDRARD